ncbi:predicted protein [Naegleria gruberi]|uniref:Predicted protein n=1 Tax=Naegleria gruberi TaxID=5762 RepID=D2VY57_NAEGR|nr:uncharacterized protein NAEGRDRAFT_73980 [Naegleria gruberi]EFC38267.1 predicted protein [Naegleria gruberi]|eukprot:XP_002671011.1 predicted protein [Naegleria gruberi strain NEG-M]
MGSAISHQPTSKEDKKIKKKVKKKKQKDLQKSLEASLGNLVSPEEITQFFNLYSSPKLLEECFFDFETLYEKLLDNNGEVRKLKVNLAVINIQKWCESRLKTRLVANVLRVTERKKLGFGLVHVAILLGQYIIHWFDDGLVHLTPIKSSHPNLAVEVGELDIEEKKDQEKIKQLCFVISEYNTKMVYNNRNCNCHHFVRDCISALDLNFSSIMKGQLGNYLRRIRNGKLLTEREFCNPITQERVLFNTHKQLDEYVIDLLTKHPSFKEEHPYDFELLKAFDRGFWMGHLKDKHEKLKQAEGLHYTWNEIFLPLIKQEEKEEIEKLPDVEETAETETIVCSSFVHSIIFHENYVCPFGDPHTVGCFLDV